MAVLDKLLNTIEDMTRKLDEIVSAGYDLDDWRDQMIILHTLQIQAQALIDLLNRLSSNLGISTESYKSTVRRLMEKGLLRREEAEFINEVIGFRNIVVHEYAEIDLDIVNNILETKSYRKILTLALELKERAKEYWDP